MTETTELETPAPVFPVERPVGLDGLPACDECLDDCGDSGRPKRCEKWKRHEQAAEARRALMRFYSVTNDEDLIQAQARQIERLQAKLSAATTQDSGKVRFARVG